MCVLLRSSELHHHYFTISFQPFTTQPNKTVLKLTVFGSWFVSLCFALAPLVGQDTPRYRQEVIVSNIAFSKKPEMKFGYLKTLARRLFTFHPALKRVGLNSTVYQMHILETYSWSVLKQFLHKWIPRNLQFSGYKG